MANPGDVAVLGCGVWGANHVRVWSELGRLAVACDCDPAVLDAVARRYPGIDTCRDAASVLARPDIAAVVVATPAPTHAGLATDALLAGKDVLVEKPMALRVEDARRVAETADRLGRVLQVGHVLEYHPAVVRLRELVEDGTLGTIRYLYANRLNLGRMRLEENVLWSFAPHDVALMLRLVGARPEEVHSRGGSYLTPGVADVTVTTLRFPRGVRGHVFVSWLHPHKDQRFIVVGDRQMAVFDDLRPWPEKLVLYPHEVDTASGRAPVPRRAEAVPVPLEPAEPLRVECEEFLARVADRGRPLTDGAGAVEVLEVLHAAERSMREEDARARTAARPTANHVGADAGAYVHPSASVDPGARIGSGTRVWHHAHVMEDASIGRDCVLGQNVFVGRGVRIGNRVKIQNNVSVYEGVELEDGVFCGPSMVFTNVLRPRSERERKDRFRKTLVLRGATLGANSTIVCGVTIGRYAFVAAGAVVTRSVPDHALVAGNPARLRGWACRCGERLEFEGEHASCGDCGAAYVRIGPEAVEPV